MKRYPWACACVAVTLLSASPAHPQSLPGFPTDIPMSAAVTSGLQNAVDIADFSLEALLDLPVLGTAKHEQKQSEAPADVSVVYAEDIERFGYRTLADVLWSYRDVFITNDRNYSYLGVRGFGIAGDYNSRVLLLIDGRRANDSLYDTAAIGLDSPISLSVVDRVEFIRGASSSLHGSNALLGVINIVTKNPTQKAEGFARVETGIQASPMGYDSTRGWLQGGHLFDNGAELLLAVEASTRKGVSRLYFPEFDDPATQNGEIRDRDGETSTHVYGKLRYRGFKLSLGMQGRRKDIPTAAFGLQFGDPREYSYDGHAFADLTYDRTFPTEGVSVSSRVFFDRYRYVGAYPYPANGLPDAYVNRDDALGLSAGLDSSATIRWDLGLPWLSQATTTLGGEFVSRFHLHQENYDDRDPRIDWVDRTDNNRFLAFYGMQELTLWKNVILNLGMRHDRWLGYHYATSPRMAVIVNPIAKTRVKVMYGSAFRAANAYERFYVVPALGVQPDVRPERIQSLEGVLERYFGDHVRASLSTYMFTLNDMIVSHRKDDGTFDFQNEGKVSGKGVGAEIEARFPGGYRLKTSYFLQNSTLTQPNAATSALSNSPRHLLKAECLIPLPWEAFFLAIEGRHVSQRDTLATPERPLAKVPAYTLANVTLTGKILNNLTGQLLIKNLTNRIYADPVGDEFVQGSIPQDGMTIWARLSYQR